MNKPHQKPNVLSVLITSFVFILVFAGGIYGINSLLYPILLEAWKTLLVSVAGSLGISLAVLSGLAQITGYSFKDMFSQTAKSVPEVNEHPVSGEAKPRNQKRNDELQKIIDEIHSTLYADNIYLPIILTKCLTLADLTQSDRDWIIRELNGYRPLAKEDEDEKYLENENDPALVHRVIEPYFKIQYVDADTGVPDIMILPVRKLFIPFPVAQIIEEIKDAKQRNLNEFSYPLIQVDKQAFLDVKRFTMEHLRGSLLPDDLRAFMKVSDYEGILNKVRQKVIEFISQVRINPR